VPQAAGRTYWVADARAYSMSEIVDTVEDLLDRDFGMHVARKRVKLPTIASHLALALDGALQAAGLYEPKLHVLGDLSMTTACSVERARRELGYRPVVGLREGMRRSIEWCLASGQRI
jgi:nucleoside-diphosphate-sugar epimerase